MSATSDPAKRQLSRRMLLVAGLQATAMGALLSRLAYLQFIKADEYATLSDENRIKLQMIAPERGLILDRTGKPLVDNLINYRLFLDRENKEQAEQSLDALIRILNLSQERIDVIHEKMASDRRRTPLLILENMSWDDVVKTEFHHAEMPSIILEEGRKRHYVLDDKAAHITGYIGRVTKEEIEAEQSLERLPEFKIGKNGMELLYEQQLRGQAGNRQLEVNALGVSVRQLAEQTAQKGENIRVHIDAELQQFASERLGEESGSIVVMDAQHGDILASTSMPAFDPNQFSRGITHDYWNSLLNNERNPLLSKVFSGIYPPGSTFKMLTALAGLKQGWIMPWRRVYCPGHYRLGNRTFKCWKAGGHGSVDVVEALSQSCDTFFYKVGEEIGIDAITEMARLFGLGAPSGLGISGEKSGLLPSDAWKRRMHDTPWVKGDTINASIGQGFMLATPMQLAIMTARLASGKMVEPQLYYREDEEPIFNDVPIATSHLELVQQGMRQAVNDRKGTAYWRRIQEEGMEMAGKTGTSQVKRLIRRGVDQSTVPWKHRHHGLFVGYAPVDRPRFIASVVIEHGGGGSSSAAPVARDVLQKVQELALQHPRRYRI